METFKKFLFQSFPFDISIENLHVVNHPTLRILRKTIPIFQCLFNIYILIIVYSGDVQTFLRVQKHNNTQHESFRNIIKLQEYNAIILTIVVNRVNWPRKFLLLEKKNTRTHTKQTFLSNPKLVLSNNFFLFQNPCDL